MKVLIVSEGKHELGPNHAEGSLSILVRRLLGCEVEIHQEKVSDPQFHTHAIRGKGSKCLKRALRWIQYAEGNGFDAVVVVIDQDKYPNRIVDLSSAQDSQLWPIPRALGVAIREFDAWMLADEVALTDVLGCRVSRQRSPEDMSDPKAVAADLLVQSDRSISQTRMYAEVSKAADLEKLCERCPKGFDPFANRVVQMRPVAEA